MTKKINNPVGKGGFREHPENINRNGAPKKGSTFKDIYSRILDEKHIIKDENGNDKDTGLLKKEALVHACFEHAIRGSFSHLKEIAERIDGKIPEDEENPTEPVTVDFKFKVVGEK